MTSGSTDDELGFRETDDLGEFPRMDLLAQGVTPAERMRRTFNAYPAAKMPPSARHPLIIGEGDCGYPAALGGSAA